jgi:hypothetical protein
MSLSLIKLLSITIVIAQEQKNQILTTLLFDYAKTVITKKKLILFYLFIYSYKEKNILIDNSLYKFITNYVKYYGNHICKDLLYK